MAAVLSPLLVDEPSAPAVNPNRPTGSASTVELVEEATGPVAEAAARRTALARLRRGRAGTIATSARGILQPGQTAVARRSLLGG